MKEHAMKDLPSFLLGAAAGALLMYYLDAQGGGRRRALVRDKLVHAGHELEDYAEAKGKRAVDKARGVLATGRFDRQTSAEPAADAQLHDRIRARLGRLVSHPRAVEVEVQDGSVRLSGHALVRESDPLLSQVREMPGVREVRNALQLHERAEGVAELQGRSEPPGREQHAGTTAPS
jgi:hypothetical protein